MKVTSDDAAVYVYTLAAIFSTIWIVNEFGIEGTTSILGLSAVLALVWTVYFRWDVAARLDTGRTRAADD